MMRNRADACGTEISIFFQVPEHDKINTRAGRWTRAWAAWRMGREPGGSGAHGVAAPRGGNRNRQEK